MDYKNLFLYYIKRTMHSQSPQLTIGETVLKESDDLDLLGVSFDSKMIFEKHLRSVSTAASQRLCILRKSWRVFHDRLLLRRCFWGIFVLVLKYCFCSLVLGCRYTKLLQRVVNGTCFFNWGYVRVQHCTSSIWVSITYAV